MNSHNPFNTGGSGCTNDFRSADQLVDRIIGDAYHVVKEVYLALGNLTYIYNYLQKYGLIITVDSEEAIKDIPLSIGKFARVYAKSDTVGYYFTDYLYVADDTSGIIPNDPDATGSWVSTQATGSNASFVRIWKYVAQVDGVTVIELPTDVPIVGVQTIYVQGIRQDVGDGFTYNEGAATITLAEPLDAGENVTVIIGITDPDLDVDVFAILKNNDGASNIGTSSGKTVQEMLDNTLTKDDASLAYPNDISNLFQEAVSLTFGDKDNAATLHVDTRGRLSVSSSANGMPMSERVSVPFSESTGYYKGPFPDTLVNFPTTDEPDDFKSYCMLMSYDEKRNIPRLLIGSPHTTNFHGYVQAKRKWGAPVNQMLEVAPLSLIGRSLINSYDEYFTLDSSNKNYYKLASISNASNAAGAFLNCILNIGDYTLKDRSTYLLNVQTPVYNTALNTVTILDMVKLTCIDGANSASTIAGTTRPTATTLVVGLVATDTGYDVWLALPAHSTYFSCTVLNAGNSDLVSFDWSSLKSDLGLSSLSGSPAANTVWAPSDVVMDSRRVVSLNDGSLFYVPEGYAMLRVYSNQTAAALDPRFQWVSSFCRRSVVDSASGNATIGCTISSFTYTITGCTLAIDQAVHIRPPGGYSHLEKWVVRLDTNDTAAKTFSFTLLKKSTTAATTYDSATSTYTTTLTEGSVGASIPTDTWIDVLVKLA